MRSLTVLLAMLLISPAWAQSPAAPGASPADDVSSIPGTSEVPGVPDQPVRTAPAGNTPVAQSGTLEIARGQDVTPDAPGEGGYSTSSGNRLAFNAYLLGALVILGLVVLMLMLPPRRSHA